jgi:hypothetical protein
LDEYTDTPATDEVWGQRIVALSRRLEEHAKEGNFRLVMLLSRRIISCAEQARHAQTERGE